MAEMTAILTDTLVVMFSRAISTWLIVKKATRSGPPGEQARLEEVSLNSYVLLQTYILMGVTGLGYLALTWSTVVLLGGFVTSLGNKDFWCLTGISMVQAARIFNDSGDNLFPTFLNLTGKLVRKFLTDPRKQFTQNWYAQKGYLPVQVILSVQVVIVQILSLPALVVVLMAWIVYELGPVACTVLSLWRLWQHDYCNTACDDNKANLVPALNIFYCLVIGQGVLFFIWWLMDMSVMWVVVLFREESQLPEKWGSITILDYLYDTRAKCWRDPTSLDGRNLINYAVDLIDSESQKDYLSGARILDNFIKLDADVRSLLLPSRPKIQKLIDTLGWRCSNRELREVVASIVAYLAGDIHLSQFPGAIHCISSLFDTTLPYWNNQQGTNHVTVSESKKDADGARESFISLAKGIEEYRRRRVAGFPKKKSISVLKGTEDNKAKIVRNQGGDIPQDGELGSKGDCWNELILQGLTILEKLVFDQHNCNDICNTSGLIPKIMAPLYSETLIQDINVSACADVVNGSFKVIHRLIRAPNWIGRSDLVHKICSNEHALSNLERILYQGKNDGTELQMRAIEILTELAIDSSANLSTETKENLIRKQLQIFLTEDEGDKDGLNKEKDGKGDKGKLRVTAGKSLALLSKMETISKFIKNQQNSIADCPNEILDSKNDITYRTVALEILENLCTHHTLDKDNVKKDLLPKVLMEVLASTRDLPKEKRGQRKMSRWERKRARFDEENQLRLKRSGQIKKSPEKSSEELKAEMEYREALLSLTFVMRDKLMSAEDFDDVARKISPVESKFLGKLRDIVEENCEDRADCLRIVKLCGQIADLMLQPGQDTTQLNEFLKSLEKASKIMSNLESCMFFAGTDCGVKKTASPLLSDLVEKVRNLVGDENVAVIG
ncbi:unnamed protein product [Triticum turgidum subsp. durum]|uniref:Uncharacterized protein n=1 Tax=Triticum turgidum subsp. durum TaxID=4567 RepID=A0A9R0QF68_TRITD|nr:unnamed protein product [Triticum turgidum subsp. durum]